MIIAVDDRTASAWIEVLNGATRTVVLFGRHAYKVPSLRYGWRPFLRGLLANDIEREWWRSGCNEGLCPILFALPLGFLVVMPRCEPVTDLTDDIYESFVNRDGYMLPVENKEDSFGWLGENPGRLVAIDYGN